MIWVNAGKPSFLNLFLWTSELDPEGTILDARLVPPTAQNQGVIEEDLRAVAAANLDRDEETLKAVCEQSIRNHDPCISCAAHFLQLRVHRE